MWLILSDVDYFKNQAFLEKWHQKVKAKAKVCQRSLICRPKPDYLEQMMEPLMTLTSSWPSQEITNGLKQGSSNADWPKVLFSLWKKELFLFPLYFIFMPNYRLWYFQKEKLVIVWVLHPLRHLRQKNGWLDHLRQATNCTIIFI